MKNSFNEEEQGKGQRLLINQRDISPNTIKPRHLNGDAQGIGDLFYSDGTNFQRLSIGTEGQVLTMVNGVLTWVTPDTTTVVKNGVIVTGYTTLTAGTITALDFTLAITVVPSVVIHQISGNFLTGTGTNAYPSIDILSSGAVSQQSHTTHVPSATYLNWQNCSIQQMWTCTVADTYTFRTVVGGNSGTGTWQWYGANHNAVAISV